MAATVDTDQLRRLLDGGAQLVEVLGRSEYDKEHLPGAVNIPLARLEREGTEALDPARPVVVYCFDYQ